MPPRGINTRSGVRTGSRTGGTSGAARRRDANRPSVRRSRQRRALSRSAGERGRGAPTRRQTAARNRMVSANQTPRRRSTAPLSERRNAASANQARRRLQTLAADRRRRERQASGQADRRRRAAAAVTGGTGGNDNQSFASRFMSGIRGIGSDLAMGFGLKEKTDDYRRRTADTTAIRRALERGDSSGLRDDLQSRYDRQKMMKDMSDRRRRRRRRANREEQNTPPVDSTPTPAPPEGGLPSIPRSREVTPDMRRAALDIFESQQGAGQVPYYMAAARNAQNPNMSPAFQYAAQNYDVLGGAQRLAPRPMEMMSVAERQQINRMAEGMANPPRIGPPRFGLPGIPPGYGGQGVPPVTSTGGDTPVSLPRMPMPSPQQEYQQGMDMVMRGGGKGGPATGQQSMPPQGLAALLAQRFGGFGGQ